MPKRILVADDSELIRRQIRTILESDRDIQICAEAGNGLDAVRKAHECRPDLAVVDVFMPEMNGLSATREIKKIKEDNAQSSGIGFHANTIPINSESSAKKPALTRSC